MMRKLLLAVLLLALSVPAALPAQDTVGAAQAIGIVGERFDGYLGMAGSASDALRRQVAVVNIKRRTLYSQLAERRGVGRDEVAIAAACQLLGRVGVGQSYMLADNVWRRRAPSESAPRPDYCR